MSFPQSISKAKLGWVFHSGASSLYGVLQMLLTTAFPSKADLPVANWATQSCPWGAQGLLHIHWAAQPKTLWLLDRQCWDWDLACWHPQDLCLPWASLERQSCSAPLVCSSWADRHMAVTALETLLMSREQNLRSEGAGGTCVPSGSGDLFNISCWGIIVIWLPQNSGSWLQRKFLRQLA